MKKIFAAVVVILLVFGFSACEKSDETKARNADERASGEALFQLQQAQPTPSFKWSQIRQNLIEIQSSQAQTAQTTTFFFNQGVVDPILSCPSIGYPIPSTAQLTNPEQKVDKHDLTIPQVEVTGIYTGESTGTHVICVDPSGQAYDSYWEGNVSTVTGPATWNKQTKQVELTGAPSVAFTVGQK